MSPDGDPGKKTVSKTRERNGRPSILINCLGHPFKMTLVRAEMPLSTAMRTKCRLSDGGNSRTTNGWKQCEEARQGVLIRRKQRANRHTIPMTNTKATTKNKAWMDKRAGRIQTAIGSAIMASMRKQRSSSWTTTRRIFPLANFCAGAAVGEKGIVMDS